MSHHTHWHSSHFAPPDKDRLGESLPVALARVATQWPNSPALLHGEQRYSFSELVQRAAHIAQAIQHSATPPGPVTLLQSLGLDAVAAWFACALAGRPFVLLEPDHPPLRLQELMDAAGSTLVLCDAETVHKLLPQCAAQPLNLSTQPWASQPPLGPDAPAPLDADAPAMVFPTSGSTGTPKLVTYAARTLQVKVQASMRLMRIPASARVLIAGSHGNYGFLHHAMVFLLSGGTLCLADVKAGGFAALSDAILRLGARHVRFTPSMFRTFAAVPEAHTALRCLQAVRFSGEPLLRSDLDLAQTVLSPDCLVQNVYGSTESALFIWSTGDEIDAAATVPMGHLYPLSSYTLKPLDDGVPDAGDTGELLIRSAYHALGDLKNGTLDRHRFVPDASGAAEAIYATGDIVRRLPGGGLVHLGRLGRMVKIRGQRVFLTEIENHLRTLPGVTGAAVVEQTEHGNTVLYGFITHPPDTAPQPDARQWLAGRLPDFMMPRRVLSVPDIPLLAGGKVDYPALLRQIPAPKPLAPTHPDHSTPPDTAPHRQLAQVWDSVLGEGFHQLEDDFIALGGDSLKLMQLELAVERTFGCRFPTHAFLKHPTLPHLATLLGIAWQQASATPHTQGLRLRLAWPSRQPSKGVVLSMPGIRGSAPTMSLVEAGLFPDHDLWAADYPPQTGNYYLQDRRWWRCAVEIAQQVQNGTLPPPRVLVGNSLGGSIAWLVGRLLAGTAQCPACVVMLDSVPLHRVRAHRHPDIDRTLAAAGKNTPPVLHICRAPLVSAGTGTANFIAWQPEDHIQMTIELPTVSHIDMSQSAVLAVAAPGTAAFLKTVPLTPTVLTPVANLDVYGVRLHNALTQSPVGDSSTLNTLIQDRPEKLDHECWLALFHLALRDGHTEHVHTILQNGTAQHSSSRLMRYAQYRLARSPEALYPENTPKFFPANIAAFEKALATHRPCTGRAQPAGLRYLWQAFDMARAFVAAARGRPVQPR